MRSFFVRAFALVLCTASIVAFAGAPAADAVAPDAHAASFVGHYTIRFRIAGEHQVRLGVLTVDADGIASDNTGRTATWSNKGPKFTLVYVDPKITEIFSAHETRRGLASRKHPGTYTSNGVPHGIWWATRTHS